MCLARAIVILMIIQLGVHDANGMGVGERVAHCVVEMVHARTNQRRRSSRTDLVIMLTYTLELYLYFFE